MRLRALTFLAAVTVMTCATAAGPIAPWPRLEVGMAGDGMQSGRLLVFADRIDGEAAEPPAGVTADPFFHKDNFVAAREVRGAGPGERIAVDGDDMAYPVALNRLPAGDYWVQAVFDRDHDFAYFGRADGGDAVSAVVRLSLPSGTLSAPLTLVTEVTDYPLWETSRGPMFSPENRAIVDDRIKPVAFASPVLSAFHGRPVTMRGLVLLPEGYHEGDTRYPVVYFTHGFAAGMASLSDSAVGVLKAMHQKKTPPMIWVFLDQSTPFGTHEFADSVNNGPWATALTTELIPALERQYRTDGRASSRFLMGHSSGGWAMLWLQVNYPGMFGGAWITAPDITSMSRFMGADLTRPGQGRIISEMARMEAVLGEYGGQAASFEAVFSPRGADGRPAPLFDRASGAIDPDVASHWVSRWDVTRLIRARWNEIGDQLSGKLHVWVGAEDQFDLDDSVRDLEQAMADVGGKGDFTYLPGKGHFDLYEANGDRQALRYEMTWQMWRRARPSSPLAQPPNATPPAR